MKTAHSLKLNSEHVCQFERFVGNDSIKNVILCNIRFFSFFSFWVLKNLSLFIIE